MRGHASGKIPYQLTALVYHECLLTCPQIFDGADFSADASPMSALAQVFNCTLSVQLFKEILPERVYME